MRKIYVVTLLLSLGIGFSWGFAAGTWNIFPYVHMHAVNWSIKNKVRTTGKEVTQFDLFKPQVDIVFVGDSITASGNWNDIFPDTKVANRGIGGETIQEISLRLDEIADLHPKAVFLMAGINDIYRVSRTNEIVSAFNNVVKYFEEKAVDVYLQSTLKCAQVVCGIERLHQIQEINSALQQIAEESNNTYYIDINQERSGSSGLHSELGKDGIHITPQGYVLWSNVLAPYVKKYSLQE